MVYRNTQGIYISETEENKKYPRVLEASSKIKIV